MRRIFLLLTFIAPVLTGCNSGMVALAPQFGGAPQKLHAPAIPLQIVSVEAGMPEFSARYSDVLAREAQSRGYIVSPINPLAPAIRLKAYLTAYGADNGQTIYSWVIDTSEDMQSRKGRVSGQSLIPASSAGGVTSLDEGTMRKLAGVSLDALTLQLTNPDAAAASRLALAQEP